RGERPRSLSQNGIPRPDTASTHAPISPACSRCFRCASLGGGGRQGFGLTLGLRLKARGERAQIQRAWHGRARLRPPPHAMDVQLENRYANTPAALVSGIVTRKSVTPKLCTSITSPC